MVSPDGLEPSTHSLKESYTTSKFPVLNKKNLHLKFVWGGGLELNKCVKFQI